MLRASWSRQPLSRQFSTSLSRWNTIRSGTPDSQSKDEATPPAQNSFPPNPTASDALNLNSKSALGSKEQSPKQAPDAHETLSSYDLALVKQRIREWTEQAAVSLRHRADDFTATTRTTFSQLGSELNRVTGYEAIEALKKGVSEQEQRINVARQAARSAKVAYEEAVIQRSNSQREVNDLLQRKSTWTDSDVSRFTSLVRQDHIYEQEELRAKAAVDETEDTVDREFSQLMRTILARYHEEQVWSDKIRSASTYGSMAALGLNMLIFIMAIVVVEPWKRRRLAQTFERKIEELSQDNATQLDERMLELGGQIARHETVLLSLQVEVLKHLETIPTPPTAEVKLPAPGSEEVADRPIPDGRRHWEIIAVGAGAFIAGILSSILSSR